MAGKYRFYRVRKKITGNAKKTTEVVATNVNLSDFQGVIPGKDGRSETVLCWQ